MFIVRWLVVDIPIAKDDSGLNYPSTWLTLYINGLVQGKIYRKPWNFLWHVAYIRVTWCYLLILQSIDVWLSLVAANLDVGIFQSISHEHVSWYSIQHIPYNGYYSNIPINIPRLTVNLVKSPLITHPVGSPCTALQCGAPLVISWSITPSNYGYKYHKP